MKYYIFYSPVFHTRSKKLAGYNMVAKETPVFEDYKGFDMLSIDNDGDADGTEYSRLVKMLSGVFDPFDNVAFVDKHPLTILKYLRGEEYDIRTKNDDWMSQVDNWKLNVRGERT